MQQARKINILIVVDKFDYHGAYINGPLRYFSWLVALLDKERFNVTLCALRSRGRSDELLRNEGIVVKYLNLNKYNPFSFLTILKLAKRGRADILHLSGYGATTFGRLAALLAQRPCIVHEHWVDPDFRGVMGLLETALARITTKAIAISAYAKDFLVTRKGITEDKIVIIPNGIPLQQFSQASPELGEEKRRQLGISKDAKVVGIVGMLHENKGHRYFIEAANRLHSEIPDARFVIIGDGELRSRLERMVVDLDLSGYVIFLGHQEDMPAILQMLDIFVMSSISETAPLSLIEAMASGRAVIATDCGGPSEVIDNGRSGLLVPIRDPAAIADKIRLLIANPSYRETISNEGQKESENYDVVTMVERIEKLYGEILYGRKQSAMNVSSY